MTTDERRLYREALSKARESFDRSTDKLGEIRKEQASLELEIANLRKTITALSAMCSEEPGIDKLGITESVIEVMATTPYSYTTSEVMYALENIGFDLSTQKNAQASVHAILTRLANKKKLTRVANAKKSPDGHPWEWRGPQYNTADDVEAGCCWAPGEEPPLVDDDIPF